MNKFKSLLKNNNFNFFMGVIIGLIIMVPLIVLVINKVNSYNSKNIKSSEVESFKKDKLETIKKEEVKNNVNNVNKDNTTNISSDVIDTNINSNNEVVKEENTPKVNSIPSQSVVPKSNTLDNSINNKISEVDLINYIESEANIFPASLENNTDPTFIEKLKINFRVLVDFVFNGGTIKGYKFRDLPALTKLKVLKTLAFLDHKIDSYIPSYKTRIKNGLNNIKTKALQVYVNTANSLCSSVGENVCNQAKSDFAVMKKSFGLTATYLKNLFKTTSGKVVNWYKNNFSN